MKNTTVAAYYFPQWHHDPLHTQSPDWSEWDTLKKAVPRFPGHNQPKVPVWGYLDESKPETSEIQINAAADAGIDVFIYDWYWDMMGKNTGKFLHSALEKGFLHAPNRNRMKFGLMWCNHNEVDRERWETMTDEIVDRYFPCPEYWEIDGKKYFSIYQLYTLIEGLGGVEQTLDAIRSFREKAAKKGYDIHLNFVQWGLQKTETIGPDQAAMVSRLGADSVTSYVWIHDFIPDAPLYAPYSEWRDGATPVWDKYDKMFPDYFPNVSMGWDSSGRFDPEKEYEIDHNGYFCTIMSDNTPDEFKIALERCRNFMASSRAKHKVVTLYAWNEWTEGGYLEPEMRYGTAYLDAIHDVFG